MYGDVPLTSLAAYMAPEVLLKEKYSEKADVYSFAMVLYELFSSHRPYSLPPHDQLNIALLNSAKESVHEQMSLTLLR
jgi:serine/threonine protein kinase